jgi:hypothetical protein
MGTLTHDLAGTAVTGKWAGTSGPILTLASMFAGNIGPDGLQISSMFFPSDDTGIFLQKGLITLPALPNDLDSRGTYQPMAMAQWFSDQCTDITHAQTGLNFETAVVGSEFPPITALAFVSEPVPAPVEDPNLDIKVLTSQNSHTPGPGV